MANSKDLSKEERKQLKRAARNKLKALYNGLSKKQHKEFTKSEKSIKVFVSALSQEAGKPVT